MLRLVTVCALCGALLCGCSTKNDAAPKVDETSTTTTEAPTTTTTVMPVPTTVPTTTTTIVRRVVTTTTTTAPEDELEVQGKVEMASGDDIDIWVAIGRCEQPGNGWRGVRWDHPGPLYGGGLGFWMGGGGGGTWAAFGGREYAPTPGQATPMQQIQVARNVRAAHGYGAWGCGRKLGLA